MRLLVIVAALLAMTLAACGGRTKTASMISTATGKPASAPLYRACGRVEAGSDRLPTYAHNVGCAVAASVAKRCFARSCFGEFALASNSRGELSFPEPPVYKPLGFECYQAVPPYAAGLPAPEAPAGGEWRRNSSDTSFSSAADLDERIVTCVVLGKGLRMAAPQY